MASLTFRLLRCWAFVGWWCRGLGAGCVQGVSIARRFALVPLGPPLLSYKSTSRAMLAAVEGGVELKVDKPVKAGDPITVW